MVIHVLKIFKSYRIISAYEDKVVNGHYLYKRLNLVNKSFEEFIEHVVASGAEKKCFDTSLFCSIDVHIR